jgi:hypothetical protein
VPFFTFITFIHFIKLKVIFYGGRLSWRSSSIFLKFQKEILLYLVGPSNVTKQLEMISCLLLIWADGWPVRQTGEWRNTTSMPNAGKPSLAGTGTELGNIEKENDAIY